MHVIFAIWLLLPSSAQSQHLAAADLADLTVETAQDNLTAARFAAERYRVDPYLVLFLAWHESRFHSNNVTPEPRGLVSCGVMTPVPMAACEPASLYEQYAAGARHVAGWFAACHGRARCALRGVAGGYRLLRACERGPVWRRHGRREDLCAVDSALLYGAERLRRAIAP